VLRPQSRTRDSKQIWSKKKVKWQKRRRSKDEEKKMEGEDK
jgi:hypothetical protein